MFNKKALLAAAILLGTAGGLIACGETPEDPNEFGQNTTFVPEEEPTEDPHVWGLVGSFEGWGKADVMLEKGADGKSSVTYTLAANDAVKVRADKAWDLSYGYDALANAAEMEGLLTSSSDGNVVVLVAGTYTFVVDFFAEKPLTITAAE